MMSEREAKLEALVQRQLAAQPLLRAPTTLEARVLAAIAEQAAAAAVPANSVAPTAPWYRQNFSRWPRWARVLFVPSSLVAAWLLMRQSVQVFAGAQAEIAQQSNTGVWAAAQSFWQTLGSLMDAVTTVTQAIPGTWLGMAALLLAIGYATLLAGGVFAYRTISKVRA
jgi:hypothetical protein